MKKLIINKLVIISEKDKKAKLIEFDNKLTVITGDNPDGVTINRTGKSVVMKSIYHSLGTQLNKYTSNWSNMKICTIIDFNYNNKNYALYRNQDRFILNSDGKVRRFNSISELRQFYVDFFDFHIRLKIQKSDENLVYAYPGAIFMPFYIDQDKGWSGSWDSFKDIFGSKWKTEVLLYHMGIRTPRYYDLLDEKIGIEWKQNENKRKEQTIDTVIKSHIDKYKNYLDINVDLDNFVDEIANFTNELNIQLTKRNQIKEELVSCFNEMREYDELYMVAQKVYNEMMQDVDYIEAEIQDDVIICPTCGTSHENSIQNRFNIYSEIEECEETMKSYFEKRNKIENKIKNETNKLDELEDYIEKINEILNKKRESVTFKEVVVAEGSRSILEDMRNELNEIKMDIANTGIRLKEITKEQTQITKQGKDIGDFYLENLRRNLKLLSVTDIYEKDLKKIKASFNSGGNDLPCAILAQVYAIYTVASKHSQTVNGPIVLDAIFQQEPAKDKITEIWDFTLNNQPKGSQLIISTTEMHGQKINGKVITLTEEKGLLNQQDYVSEQETINYYNNLIMNINDNEIEK